MEASDHRSSPDEKPPGMASDRPASSVCVLELVSKREKVDNIQSCYRVLNTQ